MVGSKLDLDSISEAQQAQVKEFINTQVRADLTQNLGERLHELSVKTEVEAPMSPATRALLLKGAYLTVQAQSPIHVNEELFNKGVGATLDWARSHGLLPHAITIGALARKTWGDGFTAGFNYGAEMNLYVQDGKIMMTNYSLKGGQVGGGTPVGDEEFYVALCFGACFGGDPNGWYMGMDGEVAAIGGGGFFLELGLDISNLYSELASKPNTQIKDLYDSATVYAGFSFNVGIGGEVALGLYRYKQIGLDYVLANPGQPLDTKKLATEAHLQ